NDPLHMGHALFTIEDIMARFHRMKGEKVLWLPGGDHAGIETQFVFEKKLAKEGKSRFDFDRKTLYQMIAEYVEKNKNINKEQLKKMGFSLDWSRYHYSLEPDIVAMVIKTFQRLHKDGLIYRGERMVNFCTKCGTAFSDLEVDYAEKDDFLYYLDYGILKIATTRPETIFADSAVAVNPKDKRYKGLIGKTAKIPLIDKEIKIISDDTIDIEFGTGALKVTPGHDKADFDIGQRHNLEIITIIDRRGKLVNAPEKYNGLSVKNAREEVAKDLLAENKLIKTEPLKHSVGICYRCKSTIEPLIMPQWFLKIKPLAMPALEAVKKGKTKIFPEKRFKKMYVDWLKNIYDWNISRQIVWGPRIPVWYCLDCNDNILVNFIDKSGQKTSGFYKDLKNKYGFEEIKSGLQSLIAPKDAVYSLKEEKCKKCKGDNVLQETDTFDTWFLSGQWPLTALGYPDSKDFKTFYPTSVMDTLWDILFFWVARMMMFGLFLAKDVPFKTVHLHCRIVDKQGQKMSKSKGNVMDPLFMTEKYGTDALRFALVFGASPGADIHISEDKIRGMRNFATKIWNASRFVLSFEGKAKRTAKKHKDDLWILKELKKTIKKSTGYMEKYRFDLASDEIYHFFWHKFCDKYIEISKKRREEAQVTLVETLNASLKLLHPFMPFVTEEIYQQMPLKNKKECLMIEEWPKS
ncbi:MAG: valine--tRNA ligase, partial [Candidatus Staskawiczbacteria bacterium]|nr:valine--tRNA ligase [Candidatus Staskawiczbacteria bacterium]